MMMSIKVVVLKTEVSEKEGDHIDDRTQGR
jgi:hypothetical protein